MLRRTLQATAFVLLLPASALASSSALLPYELRVLTILFSSILMTDTGDAADGAPALPPAPPVATLTGTSQLRAAAAKTSDAFSVTLTMDDDRTVFAMADADGHFFTGHLAGKGAKGNRFALYLDPDSRDAFVSAVAARAASAAGRPRGPILGHGLRLELREDGEALTLRIKASVLTTSLGQVSFKAALSGVGEL